MLKQQHEGQLQIQHELQKIYISNTWKENNKHIKNVKQQNTDRCGNIRATGLSLKGSRKGNRIQHHVYGDTMNVEHEMYERADSN
jgi:hypothetical protein